MNRHGIHVFASLALFLTCVHASLPDVFPECIRYEFHDELTSNASHPRVVMSDCTLFGGYIDKRTVANISVRPSWLNTTFECCGRCTCLACLLRLTRVSPFAYQSVDKNCTIDLECPFNFHCSLQETRCIVANCSLTDDLDLFVNEGRECVFDEDCLFYAPFDSNSWGCVQKPCNQTTSGCRLCKRCPSEPRTVFNASESLSSESTAQPEETETSAAVTIPPLAVLLNSTFYILGPEDLPSPRTEADSPLTTTSVPFDNETMSLRDEASTSAPAEGATGASLATTTSMTTTTTTKPDTTTDSPARNGTEATSPTTDIGSLSAA